MDEQPYGGQGSGLLVLVGVLAAVALLAICAGLVLDKAADYKAAAAEQAWAHAAQVNAQANLVDARSAQIGMVATAMSGFVVPMIAMLIVAAMVVGVFLYVDHRNQRRYEAELRASQAYCLGHGDRFYVGETELYVPNAHTRARESAVVIRAGQRDAQKNV